MKRLSLLAFLLASCGDPLKPFRAAQFYKAEPRAPTFSSLVGKKAPEAKLPDQHGDWRVIPPPNRPCVVLFADRDLIDFLLRWKNAVRARYPEMPVRWVVRASSRNAVLDAARKVPAGTRLHADIEAAFESGWGGETRGVYVFFVDARGVVREAVRGAWTFEKMEELFGAIDDFAR